MQKRNPANAFVLVLMIVGVTIAGPGLAGDLTIAPNPKAPAGSGAEPRAGVDATVTLVATAQYYFPGTTVTVNVNMSGATGIITGGQFFLAYDTSKLQFISANPGSAPFSREIFESLGIGTLDYAVGVVEGNPGTSANTTMAVIRFQALSTVCATANLVTFRTNDPPSRLTDDLGDPVNTTTANMGAITIDGTRPNLFCPANLTIECTASTDPSNTGQATATDNCDASPDITYVDDITTTACIGNKSIARTWRATDDTGNTRDCVQTILVRDRTNPVITCPTDITTNAEAGSCETILDPGVATATDNCDPALSIVGTREDVLPLVGAYEVGDTTITWVATDCAGNTRTCVQTIIVIDEEAPSITCPANIAVNADAGGTNAYVNVPPPPSIEDNCGILSVTNDYNGTPNASDTYSGGSTLVKWTVADVFGNTSTCGHTITVAPFNELSVSVQLSPTVSANLNRCVTFELFDCAGSTATVEAVIPFTFGLSLEQVVLVPAGTWTCMTARDRLHTLRRTANNFRIVGTRYVASFTGNVATGGDWLVGGNLNDDPYIDILDFGLLSMRWGTTYDSNADSTPDGHTSCATPSPHSDITGNGIVNLGDFTFIQINFLKQSEANCCGLRSDEWGGPLASIRVDELPAEWAGMAAADVNRDGVIDQFDLAEVVMNGFPPPAGEPALEFERPGAGEAAPAKGDLQTP